MSFRGSNKVAYSSHFIAISFGHDIDLGFCSVSLHVICSFACMRAHTYECLRTRMADVSHKPIPRGSLVLPSY